LRNLLDDALAASPGLTFADNKLFDATATAAATSAIDSTAPASNNDTVASNDASASSLLPSHPTACITHMHVASLERGAAPLLIAATDAGDVFAYRFFEHLSPLALTSLARSCMHAPTVPIYATLLAAHQSDATATAAALAADMLRAVLPPALPLRLRLLPLPLASRPATAEKQALDTVIEALRRRLSELCSRLVGSSQPKKRTRKVRGRQSRKDEEEDNHGRGHGRRVADIR